MENSNILDFIYANLPSDLSEVRAQAQRQTEEAEVSREQAKLQSQRERERKNAEKRAAKDAARAEKEAKRNAMRNAEKEEEEEAKVIKTKTKSTKVVGEDGFVTIDTTYTTVSEEGHVVGKILGSEKNREEEKEEDKGSKKKGSGNVPAPVLSNNPFDKVKLAGGVQSQQQIQAKMNAKKGEQRNKENNKNQKENKKQQPPIVTPPPKAKKEKKTKAPLEPEEVSLNTDGNTVGVNPQPVLLAAFGVALAVLAYVLVLG